MQRVACIDIRTRTQAQRHYPRGENIAEDLDSQRDLQHTPRRLRVKTMSTSACKAPHNTHTRKHVCDRTSHFDAENPSNADHEPHDARDEISPREYGPVPCATVGHAHKL